MIKVSDIKVICIGDTELVESVAIHKIDENRLKVTIKFEHNHCEIVWRCGTSFMVADNGHHHSPSDEVKQCTLILTTTDEPNESQYNYPNIGDFSYFSEVDKYVTTIIMEEFGAVATTELGVEKTITKFDKFKGQLE